MKRLYLYPLRSMIKKIFLRGFSLTYNENNKPKLRHVDTIKKFTGCATDKVIKAISSNLNLQLIDEKDVLLRLNLLEQFGLYDVKSLNILPLLFKHPTTLKNHHVALCEYGFTPYLISAFQMRRFHQICRYSVKELKKKGFIENNTNVLETLWKHAELDINNCPEISEIESLHSLKTITLKAFFKEKLDVSNEDFDKNQSNIKIRLLNKSFKNINKNLSIFQDIIKISNARIFINWFILFADADNTMAILSKFPSIGSTDMKVCLHVYPKIIIMPVENLQKIIDYLKEEDVPITALEKFPKILTLNCETVKMRLQELKNNEAFSIYHKHPAVVKLLLYQVKAKRRLKILHNLNILYNMHYLTGCEKDFERLCEYGSTRSSNDIINYLNFELNFNRNELISKLKRHYRRWEYVPVVSIAKNLQHLRKKFSDIQIKNNIYILFYHYSTVLQEMDKLDSQKELEAFKINGQIKKEFVLPLLIYFLEKEKNFSGEYFETSFTMHPYQYAPDKFRMDNIQISNLLTISNGSENNSEML